MSNQNGTRRGAASWGAAPHLGTLCLEVWITKSACIAQSHASARNYIFIYVLFIFMFKTRQLRGRGYAFFNWWSSWELWNMKMDMVIPPGNRHVLIKRDFNTPSIFYFEKENSGSIEPPPRKLNWNVKIYCPAAAFFLSCRWAVKSLYIKVLRSFIT